MEVEFLTGSNYLAWEITSIEGLLKSGHAFFVEIIPFLEARNFWVVVFSL